MPAEALASDRRCKTDLLVVLADGRFDRSDVRFDLADEEAPRVGMKAQEIDGSALAVARVGDFGRHLPSEGGQTLRERTNKGCVAFVEQPVNRGASPAKRDVNLGVERGGDPADGPQCQDIKVSALAAGDDGLADAGSIGDVALASAGAKSDRPKGSADPRVAHRRQCVEGRSTDDHLAVD
jgi:hypothetical protein